MELSRKTLGLYFDMGDTGRRESKRICRLGEEREGEGNLEAIPASRGSIMHWELAANVQSGHQSWSGGKEVIFIGRQIRKEDFCWNDSAQTSYLWSFTALSLCLGKSPKSMDQGNKKIASNGPRSVLQERLGELSSSWWEKYSCVLTLREYQGHRPCRMKSE